MARTTAAATAISSQRGTDEERNNVGTSLEDSGGV